LLRVGSDRHPHLTLRSWPEPVLRKLPVCFTSGLALCCSSPIVYL
jgi:hypothetical protein